MVEDAIGKDYTVVGEEVVVEGKEGGQGGSGGLEGLGESEVLRQGLDRIGLEWRVSRDGVVEMS